MSRMYSLPVDRNKEQPLIRRQSTPVSGAAVVTLVVLSWAFAFGAIGVSVMAFKFMTRQF